MKVRYHVWLGEEDEKVLGNGPVALLKGIASSGSLSEASRQMGMSYSKAWHLVHRLEAHLGLTLVEKRVGGSKGGGASLTMDAFELIKRYETFNEEVGALIETTYDVCLGDWLSQRTEELRTESAGHEKSVNQQKNGDVDRIE